MSSRTVSFLALTILFIHNCQAITADEAVSLTCWPQFSVEQLFEDISNDATLDRNDVEKTQNATRQQLQKAKISKVQNPNNATEWLSHMNVPAPISAVNNTKASAFRVEEQGWRILGADLQWWWRYYTEDDWTLQNETDSNYTTEDALDYIAWDLNVYSEVAFPCNSTLSTTLKGENTNLSLYGTEFIRDFREKISGIQLVYGNLTNDVKTQYLRDALEDASREANSTADAANWMVTASYMGVGWDVKCWGNINAALDLATEWDKAASSAATTLMALIPVLLTFGNLILPRDSEAFCSSLLVGLMSAAFSLGLPGKSISAIIRRLHRIDVGSFEHYRQDIISKLGRRDKIDGRARPKALYKVTFSTLRSWLTAPPEEESISPDRYAEGLSNTTLDAEQVTYSNTFWHIRKEVDKWQNRPHYWHIFGLMVFIVQIAIFIVGIGPLFLNIGTPLFMFSCEQYLSSLWMLITAATNAVFRFVMWEFSSHERVRVYALSEKAKDSLDKFIKTTAESNGEAEGTPKSTETDLPPRYHPLVSRGLRAYYRTMSSSASNVKKQYRRISRQSSQELVERSSLYRHNEDMDTFLQSIQGQFLFFWYHWVRFPFTQPLRFIRVGFCRGESSTESARRWRPVTILMHLSSSGRNPFAKLLTGLVEGAILLLLTIFFSSQWGGNIFVVAYTIALLLVVVTLGRLFSLVYIWQSAKTLGLHVIECQSNNQISGALRILCSMTGVLVVVNGAYYYEGHRLDERQKWNDWRAKYDRGDYDDDHNDSIPRSRRVSATEASFAQQGSGSRLKQALSVRKKPVSPSSHVARHQSEGSQSEILLEDIGYHSRMQSEPSLDLTMPSTPQATAGPPYH